VNLEQAEVKRNVQVQQHKVVSEKARELRQEVAKMGMGSFQIENLRNEIEETESTLKQLRAVKDHLEIENFNKRKTIEGELPAVIPSINQASLTRTVSLYSFAGLMFGLLAVSFFEARLHRIHHSTDVAQELGIPTLGVLPLLEKASLIGYGRELSAEQSLSEIMFADAVNGVCARLLCDDRLSQGAVIMVTSASESEGKTLLSTQLAIGLAHSGRRTLLLDGDFRKPRCHQQLGLPEAPGLNEVLNGEIALEVALKDVPNSEAKFMTSGQANPQVIKSLSNGNFANLLQRLRKDFDLIIIDSPPTLLVSDGLLIGKLADAAIMVVRSKVSKGPAVFSAFEQLSALKIPTLGVVVNATPGRVWSRYYIR
jgi:capsular exopolysaccharide synthesis family protein